MLLACAAAGVVTGAAEFQPASFFARHCTECHDQDTKKGNLDLTPLKPDFVAAENFARCEKVPDRIKADELPLKKPARVDQPSL